MNDQSAILSRHARCYSQEFLQEELIYITETLKKLGYPEGMLTTLLKKAHQIRQRRDTKNNSDTRYVIVPNSNLTRMLNKALRPTSVMIVNDTGKKVGQLIRPRIPEGNDQSIIYKIPCSGCDKSYFGESHRGLTNRLREHRADVRNHRLSNALVSHIDQQGHLPNWEQAEVLEKGLSKRRRKITEALYIATTNNTNQKAGDIKWTKHTAAFAAKERGMRSVHEIMSDPRTPQSNAH